MSRSLKKGPFIEFKLEKRVLEMNKSGKKSVVKTWSRRSLISPEFVGHTDGYVAVGPMRKRNKCSFSGAGFQGIRGNNGSFCVKGRGARRLPGR